MVVYRRPPRCDAAITSANSGRFATIRAIASSAPDVAGAQRARQPVRVGVELAERAIAVLGDDRDRSG